MNKEFIIIDHNFCPELAAHLGEEHMSTLIYEWESVYLDDVHETFNKLREKYCGT